MTVIRKAIIEIETRQKKSKLEAPDVSASERAYQAEAKAAGESTKAQSEANKERELATESSRRFAVEARPAMEQAGHSVDEFGRLSVRSFANAGRGMLQVGRGFALMAASSEKESQKMLENLFKIEAGVSLLSGGAKLAQFASKFGVPGKVVAALTVTILAGAAAWRQWTAEAKAAATAAKEAGETIRKGWDAANQRERDKVAAECGLSREIGARRTDTAFSDSERGSRIATERGGLEARLRGLDEQESADIAAAAGGRPEFGRPLRGTPARRRRIEARRRDELGQEVVGLNPDAVAKTQEERVATSERLLQLEREEFQLEQQKLQKKRQAAIEDSAGGLFGFSSAETRSAARASADRQFDAEIKEREAKHQASADAIVRIWESAASKLLQIENAFGSR